MSQDTQHRLSLLSLSIAAANAAPIVGPASPVTESAARSSHGATTKHRRLSSVGRSRRRLSDARDAATRPFPTSLQTASASLAALSLSSPTLSHRPVNGTQPIQVSQATSTRGTPELESGSVDDTPLSGSPHQSHTPLASNPANGTKSARKRGTIFTCESCSKVYRHPSCLIKHRWEHTPQWREASKFVLSKHQQVQLLEAAAILSHLSPSSASLPQDRSLWPSFLSGGLVPPPASVPNNDVGPTPTAAALSSSVHTSHPISSSVPASTMMRSDYAPSADPRLYDYTISRSGITQVRPGMLGVSTETIRKIVPMAMSMRAPEQTASDHALNLLALRSGSGTGSWREPTSVSVPMSHSRAHSHSHSLSSHALRERERRRSNAYEYGSASGYDFASGPGPGYAHTPSLNGGWSLPRSSVRSKSGSSRSRSQSVSETRSDDEHEDEGEGVDVRVGLEDETEEGVDRVNVYGSRMREDAEDGKGARRVEQTWDGMEMEMEMD